MKLNPKVKDYLEKYPEKTLLGLGWAIYWRLTLAVAIIYLIILLISIILASIWN